MKILHIITQGESGGAQKYVADVLLGLQSNQTYEFSVATGSQEKNSDGWLFETLSTRGFSVRAQHTFKHLQRAINPLREILALREMYCYIKKNGFDIVHLHSSKVEVLGSLAAKLAGAKTIFTVHGFFFTEPMPAAKKYLFILFEWLASFFIDRYICVSQEDLRLGKKYGIIRANTGQVIYNGLADTAKFSKIIAREKILASTGLPANYTGAIVGTIANLYTTKGLVYLVRAASKYISEGKPAIFIVYGEGELRAKLEQEIAKLNLDTIFFLPGFLAQASKYIPGFDVFVLPSVKEGLPYTLLEAASANVPTIASQVGGITEIAAECNIQLVEPSNVTDLTQKITTVLNENNPATYKTTLLDTFLLENMLTKISKVYMLIGQK